MAWSRKAYSNLNWTTDGYMSSSKCCCYVAGSAILALRWAYGLCYVQTISTRVFPCSGNLGKLTPYQFPTTHCESVVLRDDQLSQIWSWSTMSTWMKAEEKKPGSWFRPRASKWKMSRMLMGMQQFSSLWVMLIIPIFHFMYVILLFALGMHDVIVQFTKIVRKLKSNFLKDGWGKCLFFVVWITV